MYHIRGVSGLGNRVFEHRVDELQRRLQGMVERKTGFAEPHVKARELASWFQKFDIDRSGRITSEDFVKVLEQSTTALGTAEECLALFHRFDLEERGTINIKEFAEAMFNLRPAPQVRAQIRDILRELRSRILYRGGPTGLRGFSRVLRTGDGRLSQEDIAAAIQRYEVQISPAEVAAVFQHLDGHKQGFVYATDFMQALRGPMSDRRRKVVADAFWCLDKTGHGTILLEDLRRNFDANQHPQVLSGERGAEGVTRELLTAFDKPDDGVITFDEFLDYYKDLSVGIDSEEYFEALLRRPYHLDEGTRFPHTSPTSPTRRRVLVTHKNGNQTVEEVHKDAGHDVDQVRRDLRTQGIRDVARVDYYR
jgi:Ca2+-binding EF-hand superfamily protein